MPDRRDFLKLFGVGTAIVPIIGGLPAFAAEAKLVEPPKVELFDKVSDGFTPTNVANIAGGKSGKYALTVIMESEEGERIVLHAPKSFWLKSTVDIAPITSWNARYPVGIGVAGRAINYVIEGTLLPDDTGALGTITNYKEERKWPST